MENIVETINLLLLRYCNRVFEGHTVQMQLKQFDFIGILENAAASMPDPGLFEAIFETVGRLDIFYQEEQNIGRESVTKNEESKIEVQFNI